VKQAFNQAFQGQNKSAIIAGLMREAVERVERKQRHHQAIAQILERHKSAPTVTEEDIRAAREEGRP
jgi:predicted aspartyl protease